MIFFEPFKDEEPFLAYILRMSILRYMGVTQGHSGPRKIRCISKLYMEFLGGTVVKNLPANSGDSRDMGLIPGLRGSPGIGNGNLLQYSCLENPKDREA